MMIISLKKARKIGTSNLSLTGAIHSIKQNTLVQFESSLERDFISILEFDNKVSKYYEQPITIKYFDNNIKRTYTPDFWVEYSDGIREVIEIKYLKDINSANEKTKIKHQEAYNFCYKNNLTFKILTEKEIRTPYLKNAKFLLYYKSKSNILNRNHLRSILDKIKELKTATVSEVIESLTTDKYAQAEHLFTLWYLLSVNLVKFDIRKELSMTSVLYSTK